MDNLELRPDRAHRRPRLRHAAGMVASVLLLGLLALAAPRLTADSAVTREDPDLAQAGQALHLIAAVDTARGDDFWVLRDGGRPDWEEGTSKLELARFSMEEGFLEERILEVTDGWVPGVPVVDPRGRTWLQALVRIGPPDEHGYRPETTRLRVYAEDGDLLAEMAGDGDLKGVIRPRPGAPLSALLFIDDGGVENPPRLATADPFSREVSDTVHYRRAEIGYHGGGCFGGPIRRTAASPDGGVYASEVRGADSVLVRRFAPSGQLSDGWRLTRGEHPGYQGGMVADDEALYLSHSEGVTRLAPGNTEPTRWRLRSRPPRVLPLDGGAVALLTGGRQVLRLEPDGGLGVSLDLDLPPPGMSFAQRERRRHRAFVTGLSEAGVGELVDRALLSTGDRAETQRLHREILRRDANEVAKALVEARRSWGLIRPLAELAVAALAEHPAVVGHRLARDPAWAMLLVHAWELPEQDFIDRLAAAFIASTASVQASTELADAALRAYLGPLLPFEEEIAALPGAVRPVADRYPAPSFLVDHYLVALRPTSARPTGSEDHDFYLAPHFFLAQFAEVAHELDRRLVEPTHPDHPLTAWVLAELPDALGELEAEADAGRSGRLLAHHAGEWRRDPSPAVRRVGLLVGAALGDATTVEPLLATTPWDEPNSLATRQTLRALQELRRRIPASDRAAVASTVLDHLHQTTLLGELWNTGGFASDLSPRDLGRLVGWLDDPATTCGERRWLGEQLWSRWEEVPESSLAALAARGYPLDTSGELATPVPGEEPCPADYRLLSALWDRLGGAPGLRRDLEGRVAHTLPAFVRESGPSPPGVGRYGDWTALVNGGEEESALGRRLIPTATLVRLTAELPAGVAGRTRLGELAAMAYRRGAWAGWLDAVEERLKADPFVFEYLPAGAADRWLGRTTVDRLILTPPPADEPGW